MEYRGKEKIKGEKPKVKEDISDFVLPGMEDIFKRGET